MREVTVFVVDDDPGIRMSTERLLHSAEIPVQTFASARAFLEAYAPGTPGCVVSDIRMPEMSGIELQEELLRRGCHIPVIVITGYADVPVAVRSLKAGAVEFIEKPVQPQLLLRHIEDALQQDESRRRKGVEQREIQEKMERLTRREREVMGYIVEGKTSRLIAEDLGLSPKTIDVHRSEIMRKMGAGSIAELASMVVTARLLAESGRQDGNGGAS